MIESLNGSGAELSAGNLEVFVPTGTQIEHWTCPPDTTNWQQIATFGVDVLCVVGALQGSSSNFEVYVERVDGKYQEYTRAAGTWTAEPVLP